MTGLQDTEDASHLPVGKLPLEVSTPSPVLETVASCSIPFAPEKK